MSTDIIQVEAHGVSTPDLTTEPESGPDVAPEITLAGTAVELRPSGALYWPERSLLCIGELHIGRAERLAREGGELQPPHESIETLDRLEAEIVALEPRLVVCLGDCFDNLAANHDLNNEVQARIGRLAAGRRWVWIAGTHDPSPVELPGTHLSELRHGLLSFRPVALPRLATGGGEVSAHYHPRARLTRRGARTTRRCFLTNSNRAILPAFGTHAGGLDASDQTFNDLLGAEAQAFLLGNTVTMLTRERLG